VSPRETVVYPDVAALSRAAADLVVVEIARAVERRGSFTLALSGGSTPRALYQLLGTDYASRVPWAAGALYFGDERCVPPEHPDSNYRMVQEAMLDRLPIALSRTHRILGELGAAEGSTTYATVLRDAFPDPLAESFDVLLLGVGHDGHTASLFPSSPALSERERLALGVAQAPVPPHVPRVTLTLPVLNAARTVIFLCAGADKRSVLDAIATAPDAAARYPAARVGGRERLVWMVDRAAAGDQ
jgi:6-phosphogluconolactonase